MLGSRRVTTFELDGKGDEYDVVVQGRDEDRQEPSDLTNIFVRSDRRNNPAAGRPELIPLI